jgi:SEC-C motif-containing protein
MELCPCGTNIAYDECCGPVIRGERRADTAEKLMRSRYSAYVKKEIPYLRDSLHPDHRADFDEKSTRTWAENAEWYGLEIVRTVSGGPEDNDGEVEFIARFSDHGTKREHHELARFGRIDSNWYFVSGDSAGQKQVVRTEPKIGRNDPCPCGSGKKYKKCCGLK